MSQQKATPQITVIDGLRTIIETVDQIFDVLYEVQKALDNAKAPDTVKERFGTPTTVNVSFTKKARKAYLEQKNSQSHVNEEG